MNQKSIVQEFYELGVEYLCIGGFYLANDDEIKEHTDETLAFFRKVVYQNLDVLEHREDCITSINGVWGSHLMLQISRHNLRKYPTGIENFLIKG